MRESSRTSPKSFIAHQVLFTFKDGIDWDSARAQEAERVTLSHPEDIPQIKAWCCGRSVVTRRQAAHFSLIGYFAGREDLDAYMIHPAHRKGVELWKEISTWVVSDIAVDPSRVAAACLGEGS